MVAYNKKRIVQALDKYFYYILILILAAVVFLSGRFFLWPKYIEIKEQGVLGYNQEKEELARQQSELVSLEELAKKLSTVSESEVERLRVLLPGEVNNPDIFHQLERIALDNNLVLTRVSIGGGGEGGPTEDGAATTEKDVKISESGPAGVTRLSVSASFSGDQSYDHFKNFLASLEKNLMILDIDSLNYSPGQQGYSANMTTYYLAE